MSVQVAACSVEQLFNGQQGQHNQILSDVGAVIVGELTIPEYQRPYCWQESQLKSLLLDLKSHVKRQRDGSLQSGLPYYLGSLILHQDGDRLNVIDGQQRITTLALIAIILSENGEFPELAKSLQYEHPISQQQIKHNLQWLQEFFTTDCEYWKEVTNLKRIQVTLVVTQSEDDAYRFFETQNTGGVRLGGPDIIKAHHLRAIDNVHQAAFAHEWEALGPLDNAVKSLLKGRYWQTVNFKGLPSHQQTKATRDAIVLEFAERTGRGVDRAYGRIMRELGLAGDIVQHANQQGYEVRQPLNAGANTVRYLRYFHGLYQRYWQAPDLPHLNGYKNFISWLKGLEGCGHLQSLYEACLLMYISQFGEMQLESAAKKIFRVVYSRRVSNQKAVRENTIPAFVREAPVLDWIALSYTPEQCFEFFDRFDLSVDRSNLDKNSVKKRYMDKVNAHFALGLQPENFEKEFAVALTEKIAEKRI